MYLSENRVSDAVMIMERKGRDAKDRSWEVLGKTNLQKTRWPNAFELKHTPFVEAVFTVLRDKNTGTAEFATATHDISMLVIGEAMNLCPTRRSRSPPRSASASPG
jgi:hypothetical protein